MTDIEFLTKTFKVQFPQFANQVEAYVLRGYNMGGIRDGWIIIIEKALKRAPHDGLIDELCMVEAQDGRNLTRILKKGRKPGTWDLLTVTGPAELDVALKWAAPVAWVKPHTLTKIETAALEKHFADDPYRGSSF